MMTSNVLKCAVLAAALLAVAACGSSRSDRALSGAGIGAGAGALGGALTGDPVTGAILGGLGGAAIGGFTNESQIDLGEPIWRR